jgi:eukaryotic-like serine/threonine-protein kinase
MVEARIWKPGDLVADKYELQRPIARGGMGAVWVAQNRNTERRVAIKFMLPELATSPDTIQRFFREAKASARIDHPSIVDVLDLGTLEDNTPFMVMEFLEGRSLEEVIDREPLAPIQAAAILLDVTHALAAAHIAGIVHRDLKPANIFIAKKGDQLVPKILDFGISKITSSIGNDVRMTRTGAVLGSPAYMSPEQARGRTDIDGRADIWAIGVILYEAISGKLPFNGENYNQIMMAITLDPPTPLVQAVPSVDGDFAAIVEACLQKDRELRPPSMDSLAALLDGYVAPRASHGIPAIDIGDGDLKKASSNRVGAYAVPRAKSPSPEKDTVISARNDPAQLTVGGAVTMIDEPRRKKRNALAFIVAAALVAASGIGAYAMLAKKPTAAPAAPPPVIEPPPMVIQPPEPSASTPEVVAPSASVSAEPALSVSASAKKPPPPGPKGLVPKPKPSSGDDGPAKVGEGPGF